eukprot:364832-Chlamydomonas_euryale.AAC.1
MRSQRQSASRALAPHPTRGTARSVLALRAATPATSRRAWTARRPVAAAGRARSACPSRTRPATSASRASSMAVTRGSATSYEERPHPPTQTRAARAAGVTPAPKRRQPR